MCSESECILLQRPCRDLAAFAQLVTAGKEQLLLLRPVSDLIIGSYISYSEEVKPLDEFKDETPKVEVAPNGKSRSRRALS